MAVTPETTQGLAMTTGETKTLNYTVTNTSDAPYNVTVTHTQGDGLAVTPNPAAFTLAPDAFQVVVVSITATDNVSGAVDISFTSSP